MSEATVTLKITSYPPPPWRAGSSIPVTVSVTVGRNVAFTDTRYRVTLKCGAKSWSTATPIKSWTQTLDVSIPCDCVGAYASITVSVGWKPVGALESYTASDTVVGSVAKPELPAGIKPCSPGDSIYATFLPPATPGVGDIRPAIAGVSYESCRYSNIYCDYYVGKKTACTYAREPCTINDILRGGRVSVGSAYVSKCYKLVGVSCNPPENCANISDSSFDLLGPATVSLVFAEKTLEEKTAKWPAEWKEDWRGVSISPTYNATVDLLAALRGGYRYVTDDEKDSWSCCSETALKQLLNYVQGTTPASLPYLVPDPYSYVKSVALTRWSTYYEQVGILKFCGFPLLYLSSESQTIKPGTKLRLRGLVHSVYRPSPGYPETRVSIGSVDFQYQPGGVVEALFTRGIPRAYVRVELTGVAPTPTPTPMPIPTPTPTLIVTPTPTPTITPTPTMIPTPWVPPPAWPTPTPTPIVIPTPTPTPTPLNIWLALAILGASGVGGYLIAREVSRRRRA